MDLAVGNVIEAVDQVGNGGLACAGGAHEGQLLARLGKEADVVEDGLALLISKVHMVKAHIARQLHILEGTVLLRYLPGPQVGMLVGLMEGTILVEGHIHQSHGAVVLLGRLIHQIKDTLGAGQSHDHRVELLGDLADGVGQALGQLEEGSDDAQGDAGANAAEGQSTAGHGDDDILGIADIDQDGHEDVGVLIGLVGALKEGVVYLIKALLGLLLMAKDLDYLLAVDHLFNIAVQIAQLHLLANEVAAAAAGQEPGHQQHTDDAKNYHAGKQQIGEDHAHKGHHNHHQRVDDLGDALGKHLTEGIHVVGVYTHHVAVSVGIKILDGQGLHMAEQIIPDLFLYALRDGNHQTVVGKGTQGTGKIEAAHENKGMEQAVKHRVIHGQQIGDIHVDEGAQK